MIITTGIAATVCAALLAGIVLMLRRNTEPACTIILLAPNGKYRSRRVWAPPQPPCSGTSLPLVLGYEYPIEIDTIIDGYAVDGRKLLVIVSAPFELPQPATERLASPANWPANEPFRGSGE